MYRYNRELAQTQSMTGSVPWNEYIVTNLSAFFHATQKKGNNCQKYTKFCPLTHSCKQNIFIFSFRNTGISIGTNLSTVFHATEKSKNCLKINKNVSTHIHAHRTYCFLFSNTKVQSTFKGGGEQGDEPTTPCPVCKISLVPVIKWARNFERAASFVNKDRLTEASRTKHSSAQKKKKL